jgi:hypothetical protein
MSSSTIKRPDVLNSTMGHQIRYSALTHRHEKESGIDAGGIYEVNGNPDTQVLLKNCGVIHPNVKNQVDLPESYTGKPDNIAARKEALCADFLYRFAKNNNILVKIPSTGIAYDFSDLEAKYGTQESLLSQIEPLDPYPSRDLGSYHEEMQEALVEKGLAINLHRMLPALVIARAYDPIGQGHRNLGITEENHLFMCDFGVSFQEVPHGKGWSKGRMKDVVGQALPRMMGIDSEGNYLDLEHPGHIDYDFPSERLAKLYFQSVPISSISDAKFMQKEEIQECFRNARIIETSHTDNNKQEIYDIYKERLEKVINKYQNKTEKRIFDMVYLVEALEFIYPQEVCAHDKIQLANPRLVMQLYEDVGKMGVGFISQE